MLRTNESEQLQTQRNAYLDNKIDVAFLMEEAVKKADLEAETAQLNENLSKVYHLRV